MATAFGCYANTIKLRSGSYFDLVDPQPDQFTLDDIIGALSKLCRFGGQIHQFYSVAEHSVICEGVARMDKRSIDERKAVLLHDAPEAFVGDMVKPLKMMLPDYAIIESKIESVIAEKFGVDFERHAAVVKEIDHAVLIAERRALFDRDAVKWHGEDSVRHLDLCFVKWGPAHAEAKMQTAWRDLQAE